MDLSDCFPFQSKQVRQPARLRALSGDSTRNGRGPRYEKQQGENRAGAWDSIRPQVSSLWPSMVSPALTFHSLPVPPTSAQPRPHKLPPGSEGWSPPFHLQVGQREKGQHSQVFCQGDPGTGLGCASSISSWYLNFTVPSTTPNPSG